MILLVNGANLNLLGEREPEVYGRDTLADVERLVRETCAGFGVEVVAFQSNSEGAIIDFLHGHRQRAGGLIINPGAFTHQSYALHDCLKSVRFPAIEVHLSNLHAREEWRRRSLVAPACIGQIVGLGVAGYRFAALHLCGLVTRSAASAGGPARGQGPGPAGEGQRATSPDETDRIPVDLKARGEYEG